MISRLNTRLSIRSVRFLFIWSIVIIYILIVHPTHKVVESNFQQEQQIFQQFMNKCKVENRRIDKLTEEETYMSHEKCVKLFERKKVSIIFKKTTKKTEVVKINLATNLRDTPYPGVEDYTRYAVARLGLLPLTNVEQLKPEFGPVINDVLSFRYPITIPPCPNVTINRSVFIAVISAPNNFEKREMIRKTWKNHLKSESEKRGLVIAGFGFSLGLTTNNLTQAKIEEENRAYGDIIQIGMSDLYRNLSFKLTGLFNWLYKHCSKVDFLFKVDDDVYVNFRNLVHFVQSYHPSNGIIFGLSVGHLKPMRDGKWNITYEEWPWSQYPKYFFGPIALIHGKAFLPLLAAFQTTPLMPFEDIYYSGICREKAGITFTSASNSFRVFINQLDIPKKCHFLRHYIAWTTESDYEMKNSHVMTDKFYLNRTQQCQK